MARESCCFAFIDAKGETVSGAIIDFEEERSRHGRLFGREDVLEKLLALLVGEQTRDRGWVSLLGSPGIGKSAIVNRILEMLPGPTPPHHFIRHGNEGWDRAERVMQNLCAQIEQIFPEQTNVDLPFDARLGDLLKRVSKNHLVPRARRLFLVIDGLDESASDDALKNPLPRVLPRVLPWGVVFLCASRPTYPYLDWLNQLDGVHRVDLDDRDWVGSGEAALQAFWRYNAPRFSPPLDATFIAEAVRCAEGNLLHATRLHDWLKEQVPSRRVAANIPHGLSGFLTKIWTELDLLDGALRALVMKGLAFACAAREALPAYLFGELLGGSTKDEGEEFLRVTRPFLLEEPAHWHNGRRAYRLFHEFFRESIADKIGDRAIRECHRRINEMLAAWPPEEGDLSRRRYALRHAVAHRLEAGDIGGAQRLCTDVDYLAEKCRELGVPAVERDLEAAIRAPGGDASLDLTAVVAAVRTEASRLSAHPESLPTLLYNRLCCAGWLPDRIKGVLRFDRGLPPLRLLHGVRLRPTLLRAFIGHDKPAVACVATHNGDHLLSASADQTLRLWAIGSGDCVAVLRGHQDELTACAVTSDGELAISTSIDATIRLWDLTAHRCVATLSNDGRWATTCAVTPDGKSFAVGSDNGAITLWDRATRQRIGALMGHSDYVTACVVTPRGQLVSASRDHSVRIWDLTSRTCLHTLLHLPMAPSSGQRDVEVEEHGWITALALLPEGRQALAAAGDGSLSRWDLASGRCVQRFGAGQGRVDACAALHEGRHLLCGMADGTIAVWDLAAEKRVLCLPAHIGAVSACSATPDGRRILSASNDRSIRIWELGGPESLVSKDGHAEPVSACAITPDGSVAVSASEDRTLKIWDVATGACRGTLEGHADLVTACAISADGRRVLSGARDGRVLVWNLDDGRMDAASSHETLVSGCAITPDGRMITVSQDGALQIRSPATLDRPVELRDQGGSIDGVAITSDGAQALSISRDGTAKIWDLVSHSARTLLGTAAPLFSGALTPDGRRAVLARQDGKLEVHDLRNRQLLRVITAHTQRVFGCAVSPDGSRVVSASEDGTLRVWSLDTGKCLGTLHGTSWFRCVASTKGVICAGDQEGNLWMVVDDTTATAPIARTRRAGAKPPLSAQDEALLRDTLAHLYDDRSDAGMVAKEAGLDVSRLDLTGSSIARWNAIVEEATKQKRLGDVVRRAMRTFPEDASLIAIVALLEA